MTIDPSNSQELVAVHGVVDNEPVRVSFARWELEGVVCPRLKFYYRVLDDPAVLLVETTDFACR